MSLPCRGEVWLVDMGMEGKIRPCLVLSVPAGDSDRALFTVVPHTTSLRGSRLECAQHVSFLKAGAFDAQGVTPVPRPRFMHRLGTLNTPQLREVETAVADWLGLELSVS
ncbi:MAG TPA: type II toxin-antitoxin system PemK/MazF family toxin [Thermoanaerobaculia bacterium]|nr:type II toxin-antitoxin system PemK/MazF family toxin [Thermoanaerobaculia bacterium]